MKDILFLLLVCCAFLTTTACSVVDYATRPAYKPTSKQKALNSHFNSGKEKIVLGDYIGAKADFTEAIELASFDKKAAAYYYRGVAKRLNQEYSSAIDDFTMAIIYSAGSNFFEPYDERGGAKLRIKDYPGAIDDFTQAISLNPDSAATYQNRGLAKFGMNNDYTSGMGDLEIAKELFLKQGNLDGYKQVVELISEVNKKPPL